MSEVQLRITLLGDGAVGKTSLRRRYMGKGFTGNHSMTIGADFAVYRKPITTSIGEYTAVFQIWDLAGQKSFKNVRARFFQGSVGGLCVFDLTRRDSFTNIPNWLNELWRNNGKGVVPIILIGNKADLKERAIKKKEAENYAKALSEKTKDHGFEVKYLETSAKTGKNVEKAFDLLGSKIIVQLLS